MQLDIWCCGTGRTPHEGLVLERYGHPLSAVDMPVPEPGPRQVLVRMVASGVNHADERTRAGEFKAVFRLDLPR